MERVTAALLSVALPGLGHLYLGDRRRALAMLAVSVSMWLAAVFMVVWAGFDTASCIASLGVPYALIVLPAARDAWQHAGGLRPDATVVDSRAYVLTMLACIGPLGLPLLWESRKFGRPAKAVWTVLVMGVVAGAVWLLAAVGPQVTALLHELDSLQF